MENRPAQPRSVVTRDRGKNPISNFNEIRAVPSESDKTQDPLPFDCGDDRRFPLIHLVPGVPNTWWVVPRVSVVSSAVLILLYPIDNKNKRSGHGAEQGVRGRASEWPWNLEGQDRVYVTVWITPAPQADHTQYNYKGCGGTTWRTKGGMMTKLHRQRSPLQP